MKSSWQRFAARWRNGKTGWNFSPCEGTATRTEHRRQPEITKEMEVMTLNIQADPVPLRIDAAGAIRVGETRVLLDLVIHAYQDGHAPEVIVHKYPTLQLGD